MSTALALVPENMDQAIRLAELMSKAKLVPDHLRGSPADCLLVVEQAMRWRLSAFAVAQCTSVIRGKLMFEGKLVAAVINSLGHLEKRLSYRYSGAGLQMTIEVTGRIRGEADPRPVEVRLADAATSNPIWRTQPEQQLAYAGARVWARRHMPELMLGVYSPEEMETAPSAPLPSLQPLPPGTIASTLLQPEPPAPAPPPAAEAPATAETQAPPAPEPEFRDLMARYVWREDISEWVLAEMEPGIPRGQQIRLKMLQREIGIPDEEWRAKLKQYYGKNSSTELTESEGISMAKRLETRLKTHGNSTVRDARTKAKEQRHLDNFENSKGEMRDYIASLEPPRPPAPPMREPGEEG